MKKHAHQAVSVCAVILAFFCGLKKDFIQLSWAGLSEPGSKLGSTDPVSSANRSSELSTIEMNAASNSVTPSESGRSSASQSRASIGNQPSQPRAANAASAGSFQSAHPDDGIPLPTPKSVQGGTFTNLLESMTPQPESNQPPRERREYLDRLGQSLKEHQANIAQPPGAIAPPDSNDPDFTEDDFDDDAELDSEDEDDEELADDEDFEDDEDEDFVDEDDELLDEEELDETAQIVEP